MQRKFSEGLRHSTQVDYHGFRNDLKFELKNPRRGQRRNNPATTTYQ